MNVNTITLDVSKEPAHESTLYLGQSDKNGTTLVVNMFDNGNVLDLTGMDVFFCMRTPGGTDYYQVQGTVSGNVATFIIDETYAAGHVGATDTAYVKVDDGDTVITSTSRVRVVVLPSATDGVEPAPAYATLIEQFLEDAREDVDEVIAAAEEIIDYNVPLMTASRRGGAKLGAGLQIDSSESLSVKPATTSTLGGVKPDGTSITVDSDGTIHSSGGSGGGDVSGVKGDAESTYRTGNVNLTPANIGAAAASHNHSASDITSGTLPVLRGGTGKTNDYDVRTAYGSIPIGAQRQMNVQLNTVDFLVQLSSFELFSGARILVKFTSAQTYTNRGVRINVNSTGTLPVYVGGAESSSTNNLTWSANAMCEFVYDSSGYWHYLGNNIDGYEDYEAQQAIADVVADIGDTSLLTTGTVCGDVDALSNSVNQVQSLSGTNWFAYKVGKIVTLCLMSSEAIEISTSGMRIVPVGALPVGWRPAQPLFYPIAFGSVGGNANVGPDGGVTAWSNQTSTNYLRAVVTYITA